MRCNRQAGDYTQMEIGEKCRSNQNAIDEVMQAVTDQDQGTGCRVVMIAVFEDVDLTLFMMAVPLQHQLFQQEKTEQV